MILRASGTTPSGDPRQSLAEEGASLVGWRPTTTQPGAALGGAAGSRPALPPRAQQFCCRVLLVSCSSTAPAAGPAKSAAAAAGQTERRASRGCHDDRAPALLRRRAGLTQG